MSKRVELARIIYLLSLNGAPKPDPFSCRYDATDVCKVWKGPNIRHLPGASPLTTTQRLHLGAYGVRLIDLM